MTAYFTGWFILNPIHKMMTYENNRRIIHCNETGWC
jgi:hypothetical protein